MHQLQPVTGSPAGCASPDWLAIDPASGSAAAGETGSDAFTFHAADLATGTTVRIRVKSGRPR